MRAFWAGSINFGIVDIKVKMYGATGSHGADLHELHENCQAELTYDDKGRVVGGPRIRMERECKQCGKGVAHEDLGKCHVTTDGHLIALSQDEVDSLPGVQKHTIALIEFVDPVEVDPTILDKSYYVRADVGTAKSARANKAFVLFVEALRDSGKAAIGRVVLRTGESLVMLTVMGDMLRAQTLLWADQVREPAFQEPTVPAVTISDAERQAAGALIAAMGGTFDHARHTDERELALAELIDSKRPMIAPMAKVIDINALVGDRVAELSSAGA